MQSAGFENSDCQRAPRFANGVTANLELSQQAAPLVLYMILIGSVEPEERQHVGARCRLAMAWKPDAGVRNPDKASGFWPSPTPRCREQRAQRRSTKLFNTVTTTPTIDSPAINPDDTGMT